MASDIPADYRDRLDLRTVIAEIDRKRAETQKLLEESEKFIAEQHKLMAERDKLGLDRQLAVWVVLASLFSNILIALLGGVTVAVISHFWK